MLVILQVVNIFLIATAMSMALAHALEFPGKLRLDRDTYLAVQRIYYPGFTVAGMAEPLAVISTLILLLIMPNRGTAFWLVLVSFAGMLSMHAIFWLVTQPTNRYWLKNQPLSKAGNEFFSIKGGDQARTETDATESSDWKIMRMRWEYSHIIRSVLSIISLVTLAVAIVSLQI